MPNMAKATLILSIFLVLCSADSNMWNSTCETGITTDYILNCSNADAYAYRCKFNGFVNITSTILQLLHCRSNMMLKGGTVTAGMANGIAIIVPSLEGYEEFKFPFNITVKDVTFGTNAIFKFTGSLPPNSSLAILNNSFSMTNLNFHTGTLVPGATTVAAIILGSTLSTMLLTNHTNMTVMGNSIAHYAFNYSLQYVGIAIPLSALTVTNYSNFTMAGNKIVNTTLLSNLVGIQWFSWGDLTIIVANGSHMAIAENTLTDPRVGGKATAVLLFANAKLMMRISNASTFYVRNNSIVNAVVELAAVIVFLSNGGANLTIMNSSALNMEGNSMSTSVIGSSATSRVAIIDLTTFTIVLVSISSRLLISNNTMIDINISTTLTAFGVLAATFVGTSPILIQVTNHSSIVLSGNSLLGIIGPKEAYVVFIAAASELRIQVSKASSASLSNNALNMSKVQSTVAVVSLLSNIRGDLFVTDNATITMSQNTYSDGFLYQDTGSFATLVLRFSNVTISFISQLIVEANSIRLLTGYSLNNGTAVLIQANGIFLGRSSRIDLWRNTVDTIKVRSDASVVRLRSTNMTLNVSVQSGSTIRILSNALTNAECPYGSAQAVQWNCTSIILVGNSRMAISNNNVTGITGDADYFTVYIIASIIQFMNDSTLQVSNNYMLGGNIGCQLCCVVYINIISGGQLLIVTNSMIMMDGNSLVGLIGGDNLHAVQVKTSGITSVASNSRWIIANTKFNSLSCTFASAIDMKSPSFYVSNSSSLIVETVLISNVDAANISALTLSIGEVIVNYLSNVTVKGAVVRTPSRASFAVLVLGTRIIQLTQWSLWAVTNHSLELGDPFMPIREGCVMKGLANGSSTIIVGDNSNFTVSQVSLESSSTASTVLFDLSSIVTVGPGGKVLIENNAITAKLSMAVIAFSNVSLVGAGAAIEISKNTFLLLSTSQVCPPYGLMLTAVTGTGSHGFVSVTGNTFTLQSDVPKCPFIMLGSIEGVSRTLISDNSVTSAKISVLEIGYASLPPTEGALQISSNLIHIDELYLSSAAYFIHLVSWQHPGVDVRSIYILGNVIESELAHTQSQQYYLITTIEGVLKAVYACQNVVFDVAVTRPLGYFLPSEESNVVRSCSRTYSPSRADSLSQLTLPPTLSAASELTSFTGTQHISNSLSSLQGSASLSLLLFTTESLLPKDSTSLPHSSSRLPTSSLSPAGLSRSEYTMSNTTIVFADEPRKIIPVPVPPTTTAALSLVASAVGGTTTAVDAQTVAVIGLVACSNKGGAAKDDDKDDGDVSLRALSVAALDNSCKGVLIGNTIVVAAAAFISLVAVAACRIVLVKRYRITRASRGSAITATRPTLTNACGLVRAPQLFISLCVYFMNSYAVCGLQLSRSESSTQATTTAGAIAFIIPLALVICFPVLTYLFGARRLLAIHYEWKPRQLGMIGSAIFQSWTLDVSVGSDKLFGCVFGSYRWLGCQWSLVPHLSFLASLPMILASSGSCGALFTFSAVLYFVGALVVIVSRPRRSTAADVLHSLVLLVNGLVVANAAVLVLFPEHSGSSASRNSLEHLGTAITVLSVLRVAQSVGTVVLSLLVQRGLVGGVVTVDVGLQETSVRSGFEEIGIEMALMAGQNASDAVPSKRSSADQHRWLLEAWWAVTSFECRGSLWPLPPRLSFHHRLAAESNDAGGDVAAALLGGLLSMPPMGLPDVFEEDHEEDELPSFLLSSESSEVQVPPEEPKPTSILSSRLSQYHKSSAVHDEPEATGTGRFLTEEERQRGELALDFLRQQLKELSDYDRPTK